MRKVKVAAAFLCLLGFGMITSVSYQGSTFAVAHANQSAQLLEIMEEPVTTAASIETTKAAATSAATAATTARQTAKTTVQTNIQCKAGIKSAIAGWISSAAVTSSETTDSTTTTTTTTDCTETTVTLSETTALPEESGTAPEKVTVSEQDTTTNTTATTYTEPVTVPETEPVLPAEESGRAVSVTEREYIMLCNVVGHEYGSDFVPVEEKALVAEVIMNRVNSPLFPNTIYEVLTQPNQFTGLEYLIEMETFSYYVTPSVREAVDLYLAHPEQFNHGYLFFNGDGTRNYFRCSLYE